MDFLLHWNQDGYRMQIHAIKEATVREGESAKNSANKTFASPTPVGQDRVQLYQSNQMVTCIRVNESFNPLPRR
eukprot:COSAG02_NODE_1168_length_14134_cov_19.590310_13_plen_74_part_00